MKGAMMNIKLLPKKETCEKMYMLKARYAAKETIRGLEVFET